MGARIPLDLTRFSLMPAKKLGGAVCRVAATLANRSALVHTFAVISETTMTMIGGPAYLSAKNGLVPKRTPVHPGMVFLWLFLEPGNHTPCKSTTPNWTGGLIAEIVAISP